MKNKNKKWTNEEDLVIISMRKEGKSNQEIADALGRTLSALNVRCSYLIEECKLSKKQGGTKCSLNYDKIGEYVSKSPGNIREGLRRYAKDFNVSYGYVYKAYYNKKQKCGRTRVKDRGHWFSIVGSKGHTINNEKITNNIKRSNLWLKMKDWLFSALLS